eukprot:9735888-Prorocentrum_lima.AAC.1
MTSSLVGSEMCIRDSVLCRARLLHVGKCSKDSAPPCTTRHGTLLEDPVSYTHLTLPTICSV